MPVTSATAQKLYGTAWHVSGGAIISATSVKVGSGSPQNVVAPSDIGDVYIDSAGSAIYDALNTTTSGWAQRENAGDNPNFNSLTVSSGATVSGALTVDGGAVINGGFSILAVTRQLPLTDAKSDAGVALTATATGGAMGVSRTAGTSMTLVGETATSNTTKTDKAMFELVLPPTYESSGSGAVLPVTANLQVNGGGTINAASNLQISGYVESGGVETAMAATVSGGSATSALISGAAAANYPFVISGGTNLAPGAHIVIEAITVISSTSGSCTAALNSLAIQA